MTNINENTSELNPNPNLTQRTHQVQISNPDKDKFLFFMEPNKLAVDCCCGCSLKTGVQIIAILYITAALSNFFTTIKMATLTDIAFSGFSFLLYFIAGVSILYSTMTFDFIYAHTGYFIYAVIFIVMLVDNLIVLILIFAGIYKPLGSTDQFRTGLLFLSAILITMAIQLYMVWIVFCYSIHLKHKRIPLISGYIYYKFDDVLPVTSERAGV
jgi:hypothetical protein